MPDDKDIPRLDGDIAVNASLVDEDGVKALDGVALTLPLRGHTAIVGDAASGKSELAMVLGGLIEPSTGNVAIGGQDLSGLPENVTGRRIGYVSANAYLQNASIGDNLVYGLKNRPPPFEAEPAPSNKRRAVRRAEAERAGNSPYDFNADWIDYAAAGVSGPKALGDRVIDVLRLVDLDRDVYAIGLRGCIDPGQHAETAAKILEARAVMHDRARDPAIAALIEPFDESRYNGNATVGENLLFGAPLDDRFDMDRLAEHPYVLRVLEETGLIDDFVDIGRRVAETMVELFADLPPSHEFFQQYSFISAPDLPAYRMIVDQARLGGRLSDEDRLRLLSLPFMLITDRHRLGLIDAAMQERILVARHAFAAGLPADLHDAIAFFDRDRYNPAASIQDNILFGKLAYGHAYGEQKVGELIQEVVDGLGLRDTLISVGLHASVGVGGSRLSPTQRQKLAIGRAVLKRPDLLIVNEAAEVFDHRTSVQIVENVLAESKDRGVVWVMSRAVGARDFDNILVMRDGKVAEQGSFEALAESGGPATGLLDVA